MKFLERLVGTLALRLYVFLFLLAHLWAATRAPGAARTLVFTVLAWGVVFAAEACSIRTGLPFGWYRYLETTRSQKLWFGGVPVVDSLSFTFPIYVGYAPSGILLQDPTGPGEPAHRPGRRVALGTLLVILLDVVIDPLAVRGDRWFLGKLIEYADGGIYFGVPLSNFAGWAVVSGTALGLFTLAGGWLPAAHARARGGVGTLGGRWRAVRRGVPLEPGGHGGHRRMAVAARRHTGPHAGRGLAAHAGAPPQDADARETAVLVTSRPGCGVILRPLAPGALDVENRPQGG